MSDQPKTLVVIDETSEVTPEQWELLLKKIAAKSGGIQTPKCDGPQDIFRSRSEDLGGEIEQK